VVGLNGMGKILTKMGFEPRSVQLVTSHYTDYAIQGPHSAYLRRKNNAAPTYLSRCYIRCKEYF
jgi:hypothetical protein